MTPREQQTLDLVLAGLSTKAIADRLEISTNTAAQHIKVILRRYGVGSRVALLVLLLGDDRERPSPVALAPREREALELLLVGLSARQIAARLGVGVHAANQLTKAIFRRHGVGSRAELLARLLYRSIQPHAFGADDPETPHARLPPADHAPPARSSEVRAPRSVRGGGEGDAPPPGRARRRGRRARGPEKVVSRR